MKLTAIAAAALLAASSLALAQPANRDGDTPAVASPDRTNPQAPVAGANSFTEGQAKSRIEGAGYADVSALQKDKDGVWRGKGTKGGQSMDVSVDFQGNVTPR